MDTCNFVSSARSSLGYLLCKERKAYLVGASLVPADG
jgi:hypothetical protein